MKLDKGLDGRGIYRAIYTSLWDDIDFRKLSPDEKLVFLNLRTSPLTNMPCIYAYYIEAIERQTGLDRERIQRALDTLRDAQWISLEDGIVWVRKGLRFDPNIVLVNEKHLIAIKNIILSLPKLQIVRDFIDFYKINIPYPIPSQIAYGIAHGIQDPNPKPEKEKDKKKEEDRKEEEKPVNPLFLSSKGERQNQQTSKKTYYPNEALTREERMDREREKEKTRDKLKAQAKEMGVA